MAQLEVLCGNDPQVTQCPETTDISMASVQISCTACNRVQHFQEMSECMLISAMRPKQSKCNISQSTRFWGTQITCAMHHQHHLTIFFHHKIFAHISVHSSPERSSGLTKRFQGKGSDMNCDHCFCSNEEEISELGT